MSANQEAKCKDRIKAHYQGRIEDIRQLWQWGHQGGNDSATEADCKTFLERFDATIREIVSRPDVTDEDWREFAREFADETFNTYGLSWGYVSPGTFDGQRRGYFCWLLSWGGPSDEFRFFCDEQLNIARIEYRLADWGDQARKIIRRGPDFDLLDEIWDDLKECDMPRHWMEKAGEV